ncbi:hypothetical protein RFI_05902 [Reticulomyxa filosa]|uniref:Uncharacterized protein n=1 Tax=Reticulomyxa filosa TaxID=46433 RepID=X6NZA2_RETFI|nr:hypothetical protein RFI_05902 [Reticulomyxa filosa]|eukprot:ETO31213.1 hypothetical protein RFI_05902 [Reticulomyxa filosa]
MQFSSNYKDEKHKIWIEYTSSASDTLEIISENIVRTESPFMYHIVLLTSKELKNGEYYMQPIIDGVESEVPNLFEKIASGANVYWCVWDSNPFKSQSNKWIMKIKTFENVKRNNYQMTWISDEQWRIDPNVQVDKKKLIKKFVDTIKTDLSTLINGTDAPPWEGVLSIIFIFDFVECINKTKLLQPQ